jgi:hypothetical protein
VCEPTTEPLIPLQVIDLVGERLHGDDGRVQLDECRVLLRHLGHRLTARRSRPILVLCSFDSAAISPVPVAA